MYLAVLGIVGRMYNPVNRVQLFLVTFTLDLQLF